MIGGEVFERHNLEPAAFSSRIFSDELGRMLVAANLPDIAADLKEAGEARGFLAAPLSPDDIRTINSTEALLVAQDAAVFQERVQQVEIVENYEPLDDLRVRGQNAGHDWTFTDTRYHKACGDWAGQERLFRVRRTFANTIANLSLDLRSLGYGLHFEDGFRPLGVQEGLFSRRYQMAADEHPEWTHEQKLSEARSKTAYTPRFAAHKSGAAVDVRLRDLSTGQLVDIGHDYPDGGAHVAIDSPLVTQRQWQNRQLLSALATRNGITMYPFEDWHLCIGDTTAAACTPGELPVAVYGPVKQFDPETGEIVEGYQPTELDEVFSVGQEG